MVNNDGCWILIIGANRGHFWSGAVGGDFQPRLPHPAWVFSVHNHRIPGTKDLQVYAVPRTSSRKMKLSKPLDE